MVSHDNKDIELEKRGDVLPTTTTNSRGESRGETLPGWTIMRPLRMRGLKGKKNGSGESSLVRSAGGFAEDGDRDVKGSETTEGSGIGEVEGLGDLRSDDELLSGEEEEDLGRVNGIVGVDGEVAGENRVYKVYKRRWFGLVQLVLLNIVVSWDWLSWSANSTTATQYYDITPSVLNWLATAFMFAFVIAAPFALYTLHHGGPKPAIIIASILILLGNWIRYGATRAGDHGNYGGVMFGQILTGIAQPFVLAAPTRYSDLWFTNSGRVAATAIMSLANPFGGAIAQLVGPALADTASEIPNLVLYIAIIASVASIPSFFIPSHPPTPSSPSGHTPKQPLGESLRALVTMPEFWMIMLPFTVYVGLFNSISSLINQILQPYSYTETESGIAGALLIVVGLVVSAITSPIVDKTKTFLIAIKIQVPIVALAYLAFTWAPQVRTVVAPYAILAILGSASFSLVPVVLEYLIEITHPVSPEVTSTICWAGGQLLGGIFLIVSDALRAPGVSDGTADNGTTRPPGNMYKALIFQTVLALVVVPLPLALGCCGRHPHVRMRRVEADRESEARARDVEG